MTQKRQRLASQERARFSGSSGVGEVLSASPLLDNSNSRVANYHSRVAHNGTLCKGPDRPAPRNAKTGSRSVTASPFGCHWAAPPTKEKGDVLPVSDNWFLNDEYDGEADAPRGLRDAYRALKSGSRRWRRAFKAQADLADAQKATKQATFEQLLADKNVPAKVARWMKRDEVDPTSEAIDKWLAENGEDFGWKPQQTQNGEARLTPLMGCLLRRLTRSSAPTLCLVTRLGPVGLPPRRLRSETWRTRACPLKRLFPSIRKLACRDTDRSRVNIATFPINTLKECENQWQSSMPRLPPRVGGPRPRSRPRGISLSRPRSTCCRRATR